MARIICTYEDFDRFVSLFEHMDFQAGGYTPTLEELEEIVLPDLEQYVTFLIWIDVTGKRTPENRRARRRIREILWQNLELVDEV